MADIVRTSLENEEPCLIRDLLDWGSFNDHFFEICNTRYGRVYEDGQARATGLQKKCFQSEYFQSNQNLIVQGPTSAGKTFIGEVAALSECLKDKSVIFLVPLRSMVREKYIDLKKYYSDENIIGDICASSSDYQDSDYKIATGNFSIAVIVYEKYLALRADPNNSILKKCSLVIVDEMQMLIDSRGAKLEAAIVDIKRENQIKCKNIRILGLTTTFCDMRNVSVWLDNAAILIDDERPVAFKEYVISPSGKYKARFTPKSKLSTPIDEENRYPNVSAKKPSEPDDTLVRRELLLSLIKQLVKEKVDIGERCPKILVYNADKENIEQLCGSVKKMFKTVPLHTLDANSVTSKRLELQRLSLDNEEEVLFNRYMQYGVIFHHAGLSQELRAYIEDEYRDNNGLVNVIFATETLTIGINMPIDTVIIYDLERPDGTLERRDLYTYEYKNYIGRAGRFGIGSYPNDQNIGQSFLLIDRDNKINLNFQKYVLSGPVLISSSLSLSGLDVLPYALSWASGKQQRSEINQEELAECVSLLLAAQNESRTKIEKVCSSILEKMKKSGLVFYDDYTKKYGMTIKGRQLAGFIYYHDTYERLLRLCSDIEQYVESKNITNEIEFQKHLLSIELAILYYICSFEDILDKGQFSRKEKRMYANKELTLYLIKIVECGVDGFKMALLPNISQIKVDTLVEERFHALARALMLYIWSEGLSLRDNAFYSFDISSGSISKLADLTAYILEGVVRLCETSLDPLISQFLSRKLSEFSGCLQYGETLEMVKVRKTLKVSRSKLRKLKSSMIPSDPDDFIEYITRSRNDKLDADPQLVENARKYLISTNEMFELPSVNEEILQKYLNSYNERGRNIYKYLAYDTKQDNLSMFLDMIDFTMPFDMDIKIGKTQEELPEDEFSEIYSDFLYLDFSEESSYRIILYYDHWKLDEADIELEDFKSFLEFANALKIRCVVGPKLPQDCIDLINNTDILYIDKHAFLLSCLFDYRLKKKVTKKIFFSNKGYIVLSKLNAIYKKGDKQTTPEKDDFFISYCSKDKQLVEQILNILSNAGFTYWCDLTSVNSENDIDTYITKGFNRTKAALIIGTAQYFSDWKSEPYRKKEFQAIVNNNKMVRILCLNTEVENLDKLGKAASSSYVSIIKVLLDSNNISGFTSTPNFEGVVLE